MALFQRIIIISVIVLRCGCTVQSTIGNVTDEHYIASTSHPITTTDIASNGSNGITSTLNNQSVIVTETDTEHKHSNSKSKKLSAIWGAIGGILFGLAVFVVTIWSCYTDIQKRKRNDALLSANISQPTATTVKAVVVRSQSAPYQPPTSGKKIDKDIQMTSSHE
eukprot:134489_1